MRSVTAVNTTIQKQGQYIFVLDIMTHLLAGLLRGIVSGTGVPLSLNLYTYGFNNPTRCTDLSGHFPALQLQIGTAWCCYSGSFTGCQDKNQPKVLPCIK